MAARTTIGLTACIFCAMMFALAACDYKPRNQGRALYESECQSCHMEQGQGLGALMPPVAHADFVVNHPERLACIIRHGMSGEVTVNGVIYNSEMPGNSQLTDVEISNLVYYLLEVLNEKEDTMNIGDIRRHLERCRGH